MKRIYTLLRLTVIVTLFAISNGYGQKAPDWTWAKRIGGNLWDSPTSMATDAAGNVYLAGEFSSHYIVIGADTLYNADTSNALFSDIFLAKFDATGKEIWAKRMGGKYSDDATISVDNAGNIYLTGSSCSKSIMFGSYKFINPNTIQNNAYPFAFLVKYNSNGNVIWAKSFGTKRYTSGKHIANDKDCNVYLCGDFQGYALKLDTITLINPDTSTVTDPETFIAKCDSGGHVIWAKSAGCVQEYSTQDGIAVDISGNVYMAGTFSSAAISFGQDTLYIIDSSKSLNNNNGFLVKYNTNGNIIWVKSSYSTGKHPGVYVNSVAADALGGVYITGRYYGAKLKLGNITTVNKDSVSYNSAYIAKYDSSGKVIWAKSMGDELGNDEGISLCIDIHNQIYLTGSFQSAEIAFDKDTLINTDGKHYTDDVFITKYDTSGKVLWVKSAGGYNNDDPCFITTDVNMNIYIAGQFSSHSMAFGKTTLVNPDTSVYSTWNHIFFAKMDTLASTNTTSAEVPGNTFNIYPNPTTKQFTILLPVPDADITITDDIGRPILHTKAIGNKATLELNNAGLYFIQAQSGTQRITQKLVVIKN